MGLTVLRVLIGVFFISQGLTKLHWFGDTADLAGRFARYLDGAGPIARAYLETFAIPGTAVFARLVPLGELGCGLALVLGIRTQLVALVALFMTLNFHFAGGTLFTVGFLSNGFGLPVLGSLVALAISGAELSGRLREH